MRRTTRDMSDAHEIALVEAFGGRRTPGSGNQYNNPMDGRQNRYTDDLAFAWDGKSTLGKGITIDLPMIEKAREQALGERPMIALRWYATERLAVAEDWVAVTKDDMEELLDLARWARAVKEAGCVEGIHDMQRSAGPLVPGEIPKCTGCGLAPYEAGR